MSEALPPREPWSFSFVFQDFHLDHPGAKPFVLALARGLASESLARESINELAAEHGIADIEAAKPAALDLVLYYIRHALIDHSLSQGEIEVARRLKRLLHVDEGDLWRWRRAEVTQLVSLEMERILADHHIDYNEELHQVELQALFDLSYDQYLELTKDQVAELVAMLLEAISEDEALPPPRRRELENVLHPLLPLFHLQALMRSEHLDDYLPTRVISQQVKDLVWRRDAGRCVECGSQENLEFDHIIPFSKGGASTYRNVQLLCQTCNRRKSNAIG